MSAARHDPTGRRGACGEVLLLGELNPYGSDPFFALWDEPDEASGNRLRLILGLERPTYRALHRANLCSGAWSMRQARERAGLFDVADASRPWKVVVLLGRKVARAFNFAGDFFSAWHPPGGAFCGPPPPTLISLPHPSGLNRAWNARNADVRARALLRSVAPGVPWGETLSVEEESADDWDVRDPRDS